MASRLVTNFGNPPAESSAPQPKVSAPPKPKIKSRLVANYAPPPVAAAPVPVASEFYGPLSPADIDRNAQSAIDRASRDPKLHREFVPVGNDVYLQIERDKKKVIGRYVDAPNAATLDNTLAEFWQVGGTGAMPAPKNFPAPPRPVTGLDLRPQTPKANSPLNAATDYPAWEDRFVP